MGFEIAEEWSNFVVFLNPFDLSLLNFFRIAFFFLMVDDLLIGIGCMFTHF